jgi:hypothetical protein
MIRDFLSFVLALWREWKVLLTGGTVFAVLTVLHLVGVKPLSKKDDRIILGLTLFLAAFSAWRRQWIRGDRDTVDLRPMELLKLARDRTAVHARTFTRPYIGRRIVVTGTIKNVRGGPMGLVTLDCDDATVFLHVPFWATSQFTPLPIGASITVTARIEHIDSYYLWLRDCTVIPTPSRVVTDPTPASKSSEPN